MADWNHDVEKKEEVDVSTNSRSETLVSTQILVKAESENLQIIAPTFPEGGKAAWLTVAGAFLVQFACFGYINAFGVYQDLYVRVYLNHYSPSTIGWIGGVQIFMNFSVGVLGGRAFDRGYFVHLMIASIIFFALGLFTLSVSHPNAYYQVFLAHGVALGLSGGLSYIPSIGIVSHYFHRRRALAMGIVSAGSALGSIIHPIMLNRLFNSRIGFHNGVRISAAMNTFLLLVALSIMRTRLPPRPVKHYPILQWFKEPPFLSMVISSIFIFLGLFYPVFYVQLNAITHGVDRNVAFYSISILNAASLVGRTIPGALAPKLGVMNLASFFTVSTGLVVFGMLGVKDATSTIIFAIFYGFFSGGAISLTPPTIAVISADMSEIGARLGLVFATGGIFGLVAIPISGALLTKDNHWIRPTLFVAISLLIAGFGVTTARSFAAKKRGTQRV